MSISTMITCDACGAQLSVVGAGTTQTEKLVHDAIYDGWEPNGEYDLCPECATKQKESICQLLSMSRMDRDTWQSHVTDEGPIPASDAALPSSLQVSAGARKTALGTCSVDTAPDGSGSGSQG